MGERAGNSSYHALIVKLDKRYSSGVSLLSSYVLSKMIGDSDSTAGPGRNVLDQYNRGLEKGLVSDDSTHACCGNAFTYDLPMGKGKNFAATGVPARILGGWSVAGILEYSSGTPYNVSPGITAIPGLGNRVFINSYDNWRATTANGSFDPFKDV